MWGALTESPVLLLTPYFERLPQDCLWSAEKADEKWLQHCYLLIFLIYSAIEAAWLVS